jgi:hypothetical protein
MKRQVNIEKVAKGLRASRRGKVNASSGYFGAMQLVDEVQARFRVPIGGGRATDPSWKKRRLVPLADETLRRLEQLAHEIEEKRHVHMEPMQVAALLLEKVTQHLAEEDAELLIDSI